MKYLTAMGLLCAVWLASVNHAWAEEAKPLTVKEFIAKEHLDKPNISGLTMVNGSKTIPSLFLGSARPFEQFEVEGYVQSIFRCPACPPGAACGPCNDHMVISDQESCIPVEKGNVMTCPDILGLWLDYPNNYAAVTVGTKIKLKVEIGIATTVTQMITPESRQKSERYQQIFKDTMDKQPGFQPVPCPTQFKDIPCTAYKVQHSASHQDNDQ